MLALIRAEAPLQRRRDRRGVDAGRVRGRRGDSRRANGRRADVRLAVAEMPLTFGDFTFVPKPLIYHCPLLITGKVYFDVRPPVSMSFF